MQSDAFPTPPIYSHHFQPNHFQPKLVHHDFDDQHDGEPKHLLNEIELLIADCSIEESKSFWLAVDRLKLKHRVTESMQKIERLFFDLAKESTNDPELIATVSNGLRYVGNPPRSYQK